MYTCIMAIAYLVPTLLLLLPPSLVHRTYTYIHIYTDVYIYTRIHVEGRGDCCSRPPTFLLLWPPSIAHHTYIYMYLDVYIYMYAYICTTEIYVYGKRHFMERGLQCFKRDSEKRPPLYEKRSTICDKRPTPCAKRG